MKHKQYSEGIFEINKTIELGNGNENNISTVNLQTIKGAGSSAHDAEFSPWWTSGTILRWVGPIGGTMIRINGPVYGVDIQGITLDCNGIADIGIDIRHGYRCSFKDILVRYPFRKGIVMKSVSQQRSIPGNAVVVNCGKNLLENIRVLLLGKDSVGFEIGGNDADHMGCSQNRFIDCSVIGSWLSNQIGWKLKFCDSNYFEFPASYGCETALLFEPPEKGAYKECYPAANNMYMPFMWPSKGEFLSYAKDWNPVNFTTIDSPIREWNGLMWYPELTKHNKIKYY